MQYFSVQELVDKATWMREGEESIRLFTPQALAMIEGIRKFFGVPIYVNNWHIDGNFQYRGFRPQDCGVGAAYSQHYCGNAFDFDVHDMSAEHARNIILENKYNPLLKNIMRMESNVNWVHADCKSVGDRIILFNH
ncbi:MAG: hypothetical protein HQK96_17210 [Nitrospirae bacterium]|nr:hypothetical protein [Nitrospirota bacterium]